MFDYLFLTIFLNLFDYYLNYLTTWTVILVCQASAIHEPTLNSIYV